METTIDPNQPLPEQPATTLHALANAAGLQRRWRDVYGRETDVPDDNLVRILTALGHEAESAAQRARSLERATRAQDNLPVMAVADVGGPIRLPISVTRAEATGADGRTFALCITDGVAAAPDQPGYYQLEVDGRSLCLAAAPPHCPLPDASARRPWGVSLQIPSLVGAGTHSFGNFGELAGAVEVLANKGADAVAINPVHALFPGFGHGFSPYSPSSRTFLNSAMGDPALLGLKPLPTGTASGFIDWENALPQRLALLRLAFAELDEGQRAQIPGMNAARLSGDDIALRRHATFDALDFRFRREGVRGWQNWPSRYRDPDGTGVAHFAAEQADEIAFHLFAQWLARESLSAVQERARTCGMAIGLIGDLAVGVDPGGSDAWSLGETMLRGLTIGAPPDPLGPLGQNWNLVSFSPDGLRKTGYEPWIAMIRSALASSGGLRIDHAFGLARLWVVPEGCHSSEGAYVTYPFEDLVRLATLEAHLAGALIIAEDLGTSPHGFTGAIAAHHMLGMRVLWFERAADDGFIGAQDYAELSAAMTGTHDTATVAGWWSGADLDWAEKLGRLPKGTDRARAEEVRAWDRGLLWATIAGDSERPEPEDTQPVVDAAVAHVARTPSLLAIVPIEDVLGLTQQPNLPGTVEEHPNWRRRLGRPLEDLLDEPAAKGRLESLRTLRQG